jgi:hypothetical protein
MSKLAPEIQSFVQQWKLDNYEIETLLSVEGANTHTSSTQEKQWKKALKEFSQAQNRVKV